MNTPETMVKGKVEFKSHVLAQMLGMTQGSVPAPKTKNTTSSVALEAEIRTAYGNIDTLANEMAKEVKRGKSLDRILPKMCEEHRSVAVEFSA